MGSFTNDQCRFFLESDHLQMISAVFLESDHFTNDQCNGFRELRNLFCLVHVLLVR